MKQPEPVEGIAGQKSVNLNLMAMEEFETQIHVDELPKHGAA